MLVYEVGGNERRRKEGTFGGTAFVFPRWLNTCLPTGSTESILIFLCFSVQVLISLLNCRDFSHFSKSFPSHINAGISEWLHGVWWLARVKHNFAHYFSPPKPCSRSRSV